VSAARTCAKNKTPLFPSLFGKDLGPSVLPYVVVSAQGKCVRIFNLLNEQVGKPSKNVRTKINAAKYNNDLQDLF
jgi:hypothetical protein